MAVANVSGGTPGYTYSWINTGVTAATINNLGIGSYTVYVSDANSCLDSSSVTFTQAVALNLTSTQTDLKCFNDSSGTASVTATGGKPGYTYSWMPGNYTSSSISGLSAGTYTITVIDIANCPKVDLVESASWDKTKPHWLKVAGQHSGPEGQYRHFRYNRDWTKRDGGWEYTYRSVATCRDDKKRFEWCPWQVYSHHHIKTETGKGIVAHTGHYFDCKAYDGWWDI